MTPEGYKPIIQGYVHLRGAHDLEEELRRIEQFLLDHGVQNIDTIVFTGVKGTRKRVKEILANGMYGGKTTTFAHSAATMIAEQNNTLLALDYAFQSSYPLLLAYDSDKLTGDPRKNEDTQEIEFLDRHEYGPVDGSNFREALIAIIRFR